MKLIRGFEINTKDLSALQEGRFFKIKGDNSAVFSLQVKTSVGKFYNFSSKLFETTVTSEHRLANQVITGSSYSGSILFPADADGETYTILLSAEPHFDTEIISGLAGSINNTSLEHNPVLYQVDITQVADVTMYVRPTAATASHYGGVSTTQRATITKSPTVTSPTTTTVSWSITNQTSADTNSFGFVPVQTLKRVRGDASLGSASTINDAAWYASTTAVIDDTKSDDGGGSTHYNYFVDSVSDLSIGMTVTAISSGTLGSLPTLTNVNLSETVAVLSNRGKPAIKLSTAKAFADGITLTLKAQSTSSINKALGCDITLSNFKLTQTPLTTTVRGTISNSTAIDVNGTYGISSGAFMEGFGVDNSTSNPIAAIATKDDTTGQITSTVNQTLSAGTVLNIIGSSNSYTITGDITVNKMPANGTTVYLDLDQLLTLGTEG